MRRSDVRPTRAFVLIASSLVLTACGLGTSPATSIEEHSSTTARRPPSTTTIGPVGGTAETTGGADPGDELTLVEVQVLDVDDGDSLHVVLDGVEERVRLLGINAPERNECLGDASRDNLAGLVGEAAVLGLEEEDRDQFDRILAHVFASDVYVNGAQISAGLAIAFSHPNVFQSELIEAQEEAEDAAVGWWSHGSCGDGPPIEGIEIVDVEPDPPGADEENLDGEYVVIANESTTDVDLGGFVLRDESTVNRYVFDDGFMLEGGREIAVVSGCDPPSDGVAWCAEGPIWNNGGDSVILLDPWGHIVDHLRY